MVTPLSQCDVAPLRRIRPIVQYVLGESIVRANLPRVERARPVVGDDREDEVVAVSDGYARNYLFPRGLAVEAAGGALRQLEIKLAAEDRKAAGVTAPADGLYFIQAYYPEHFDLPQPPLGPQWLNLAE